MQEPSWQKVIAPFGPVDLHTHSQLAGHQKFWPRELLLGLLPLLIAVQLLVWHAYLPLTETGIADFRSLEACGYMTRTGHLYEMYDFERQKEFELKILPGGVRFFLRMNHPAYEELIFAPLSILPYRAAFLVFLTLNLIVVGMCVRLLQPDLGSLSDRWKPLPALLFVTFFPVTRALAQGQDSVLLLALLTGAFVLTERGRDLPAGILTGLGLFKFQIVLPIAVVYLLWKRWRFVCGFAISSTAATIVSLLMVGIHGFRQYLAMLTSMELTSHIMLNLRGLVSSQLEGRIPHIWVLVVIVLSSLLVLAITAYGPPSMPLAIVAASLVSYHFIAHDATILMIPIAMTLSTESRWRALAGIAVLIGSLVGLLPDYAYLACLPIFALFLAFTVDRNRPMEKQETYEYGQVSA